MGLPKSDILSAWGIGFHILTALRGAVLKKGGDDTTLRLIEKPEIADKLAALLMTEAGIDAAKPQPDTTGLEVFEIEVDGDDPRWDTIIKKDYRSIRSDDARTGDFPVKPGKRIIRYVLLSFHHRTTTGEVIKEIAGRNLSRPDRAITETILDRRKAETAKKYIVGICGVLQQDMDRCSLAGVIYDGPGGRTLTVENIGTHWGQGCCFLAVVSLDVRSE